MNSELRIQCPICKRMFDIERLRVHYCHGYAGKSRKLPKHVVDALIEENTLKTDKEMLP